MQGKFPVIELFGPTLQGEGALAGQVSYFLRTGACQYRCSWCDSMHAVDPHQIRKNAKWMTVEEISAALQDFIPVMDAKSRIRPWITLTGGDPCLWNLECLVKRLYAMGLRVAVETQGARWQEWLTSCDLVTVSPKGPSSGMADRFDVARLQQYSARLRDRMIIKFVICSDDDLDWARRIRRFSPRTRLFLSVGTPPIEDLGDRNLGAVIFDGYRWLADKVFSYPDLHDATVLPQLHTLIWGRSLGR